MTLYEFSMRWIRKIFDHFQPQGKCTEAVRIEPNSFEHVPDFFKTQEMCIKAAEEDPRMLKYLPDQYKTQGMCIEVKPWQLGRCPCSI